MTPTAETRNQLAVLALMGVKVYKRRGVHPLRCYYYWYWEYKNYQHGGWNTRAGAVQNAIKFLWGHVEQSKQTTA